jgi:peptidyl-prolyl cis-trans isomerase C
MQGTTTRRVNLGVAALAVLVAASWISAKPGRGGPGQSGGTDGFYDLRIQDDSPVVATYASGTVTALEVEALLSTLAENQQERFRSPDGRADLIQRLALNEALAAEGRQAGHGTDDRQRMAMQMAAQGRVVDDFITQMRQSVADEQDQRAYYDANIDEYREEQVRASHILLEEEARAHQVLDRLAAGEDFEALARELSEDRASRVKGGDLGWFVRGRMVEEFDEAAFAATPGEIVGPVSSRFGHHVILCTGRRDKIPFEEVSARIQRQLERDGITLYMDEVRAALDVEIDDELAAGLVPAQDVPDGD